MEKNELLNKMIKKQLENFFLDLNDLEKAILDDAIYKEMEYFERDNSRIINKYYNHFNPYHSDQYAMFLYRVSFRISNFENGFEELADKIYYLNKIMHSIDIYHKVKLPRFFFWEHPVGTVIGRAKYGEYFMIQQNCTIGGNYGDTMDEVFYPEFLDNVTMFSYSSVVGKSKIGSNVIIASHAFVKDEIIPDNSVVFGSSPKLIIKPNNKNINFFQKDKQ